MQLDADAIFSLPPEQRARALELLRELDRRDQRRRFYHLFPDETHVWRGEKMWARHLYPKHLEWFRASATYREVCFLAANRVGKTLSGAFSMTAHVTGDYPAWWDGKRFTTHIRAWACGKTNETTRDIVQSTLLGEITYQGSRKTVTGTGMIPGDRIGQITWKQGVADLVDTVKIRHETGKWSLLGFKSYQQGRGSFEGTAQHVIWPDEEPPVDIYTEMLTRTATTGGTIQATFTPLEGLSEVTLMFMPQDSRPDMAA